jgi:hypothetical protein
MSLKVARGLELDHRQGGDSMGYNSLGSDRKWQAVEVRIR